MKKNLRKMLALMLALALSLTMLQGVAFANPITGDGYTFENGVLTITSNDGTINWHINNNISQADVRKVIIKPGVTEIKYNGPDIRGAFQGCDALTMVTGLDNVTTIEGNAFYGCDALTMVTGLDNLTSIENHAFYGCDALKIIDLSRATGLTEIGSTAFAYCRNLTTVLLPEGLQTIGVNAFSDCSALTSITLPQSLKTIGESAFSACTSLQQITIPAGVETIGIAPFGGSALTSITFEGTPIIDRNIFGVPANHAPINTINFAGAYVDPATATMAGELAKALTNAGKNPIINYNQNWPQAQVDTFKQALQSGGLSSPNINPYNPNPTGGSGGSSSGTGAGVWYPGQASGGITYTQIVDETATTAMLQTGSVITVTGTSPTGIIVKLDPTALSGHNTITINNSIENITLTATQIANLVQQADGGVVHVTIKQTPDGVSVTATAGGRTITL